MLLLQHRQCFSQFVRQFLFYLCVNTCAKGEIIVPGTTKNAGESWRSLYAFDLRRTASEYQGMPSLMPSFLLLSPPFLYFTPLPSLSLSHPPSLSLSPLMLSLIVCLHLYVIFLTIRVKSNYRWSLIESLILFSLSFIESLDSSLGVGLGSPNGVE